MRNLKFIVSAAAVVGALAGITAASAADLAPRYTKAPPLMVEPAFNWSGFYAGGNIGYSWGRSSNTETISNLTTLAVASSLAARDDVNGVIGGAQFGYNWQAAGWLFGLETDIQGSGERGSLSLLCVACNNDGTNIAAVLNQKLNWFGTLRGRVGGLVTPDVLLYGTGGLAYGGFSTSGSITGNTAQGVPATFVFPGTSSTRAGWTLGAGIEGHISGNWTAKLEYLYMDFGTVTSGQTATTILVPVRTAAGVGYSSHFTDNVVRVGLNYIFNSPVVAKY
jgi:outer membrane immunogenic protein